MSFKLFSLLALIGVVTLGEEIWKKEIIDNFDSIDHRSVFDSWKLYFNKKYESSFEDYYRFRIFYKNWQYINTFNSKNENSYTLRLNQFGDLTEKEFNAYVAKGGGRRKYDKKSSKLTKEDDSLKYSDLPSAIDWTNMNGTSYVTPVKNQGNCGSCWAFSAVGSLESFYAIANDWTGSDIIELSEQQLVDCTYHVPDGCQGGLQEDAFDYIAKTGGLCTEDEYPYTARDGSCYDSTCGQFYDSITGYLSVKKDNSTALMSSLTIGPIAVSVDAAGVGWQFYSGGVYDDHCGVLLDHGVVGVGYGSQTNGGDFWKIKNSWGTDWGMQGYMLICRNCDKNGNRGECGILEDNTYPVLPKL